MKSGEDDLILKDGLLQFLLDQVFFDDFVQNIAFLKHKIFQYMKNIQKKKSKERSLKALDYLDKYVLRLQSKANNT